MVNLTSTDNIIFSTIIWLYVLLLSTVGLNGAWGGLGDCGLPVGFGENLCMLRKCHCRVLGALSKELGEVRKIYHVPFQATAQGAGDQSGLLQEQLFWSSFASY